jgi:hypothetical protein
MKKPNLLSDVWKHVDSSNGPDACWNWQKGRTSKGYGRFCLCSKMQKVHRLVWFIVHKVDPDSMDVLHACDNPSCCNPKHLFLGTKADNVKDRKSKSRPHGNKLGEDNWHAKIKQAEAIHIKNSCASVGALAACFGLSKSQVRRIQLGQRWKHLCA